MKCLTPEEYQNIQDYSRDLFGDEVAYLVITLPLIGNIIEALNKSGRQVVRGRLGHLSLGLNGSNYIDLDKILIPLESAFPHRQVVILYMTKREKND